MVFVNTRPLKVPNSRSLRPLSFVSPLQRTASFNVTIIQVYASTSGHDDHEVDNLYQQLLEIIDQTPKKDILALQGHWKANVGRDAQPD